MQSDTCYNTRYGSYQKWFIGNVVRALLIANPDITAQIGFNVFPLVAPEVTLGDFIVYARDKYSKQTVKGGVYQDECTVVLTAVADNYDHAVTLASNIDNVLTGIHTLDDGTKVHMELSDSSESFQDNKYIEILEYRIK